MLGVGWVPGETDVMIKPLDQSRWRGSLQLDNQSARTTGAVKLRGNVPPDSLGRAGDQLLFAAHATGASIAYRSLPIGVAVTNTGGNY